MCKTVCKIITAVRHDEELIPTSNSLYLKTFLTTIRTQNFKYPFKDYKKISLSCGLTLII